MTDQNNSTDTLAKSPNPADARRAQLAALIPEAFSEGQLDVAALKRALGGEAVIEGGERYALTWAGKASAYKVLQTPSTATLRPQRELSVNFDAAQHVFIEGENLEVLKVLQKAYFGRVKLIYIDPPYNTGSDNFIYPDRFQESKEDYLRRINDLADDGMLMREGFFRKNSKESGHYHSNWLSMMLPRLYIARNLLREDGVIFVSCDDNEVHNLRCLMNEVFGEENFVSELIWQKSKKGDAKLIAKTHEYVLLFARSIESLLAAGIWRRKKPGADDVLAQYQIFCRQLGANHEAISASMRAWYATLAKDDPCRAHEHYRWSDERGLYFAADFAGPDDGRDSRPRYDILHPKTVKPCKKPSTGWRWDEKRTNNALAVNPPLIHFGADETTIPCRKSYLHLIDSEPFSSVFYRDGRAGTLELEKLVGKNTLEFPKDVETLKDFIRIVTMPRVAGGDECSDEQNPSMVRERAVKYLVTQTTKRNNEPDDIVLDFFAGSGTTAQSVLELNQEDGGNRRFILVQLPEAIEDGSEALRAGFRTIADIGRERIRRVIQKIKKSTDLVTQVPANLGFKSFLLTPSNFKQWRGDGIDTPEQLAEQMQMFAKSEKDGAAVEHIFYELLLKFGQELTTPVEVLNVAGGKVFAIRQRKMLFVLDTFTEAMIQTMVEMKPREIIVIDGVFHDSDPLKSNLDLQCRDAKIKFTCL